MTDKYKGKSNLRIILKCWCICTAVFCLLMIAAYSFPDKWVDENVKRSAEELFREGPYPKTDTEDSRTQRDNYTEGYVLSMIDHRGSTPVRSAFLNPYYEDETPECDYYAQRVYNALIGVGLDANQSYGRYWQGHLTLERPLMIVTDLHGIYVFMAITLGLLIAWACRGMASRIGLGSPIILLLSLLLVDLKMIPTSTKFWYSFAIAVFAVAWITQFSRRYSYDSKRTSVMFFITGAVTVFLDFMSTPIITFMMPFATLILMEKDNIADMTAKDSIRTGFRHFLYWTAGWVMLGLTNWIIFTALASANDIDGLGMVSYRINHWVVGDMGLSRLAGFGGIVLTLLPSIRPLLSVIAAGIISLSMVWVVPSRYRMAGVLLFLECGIPVLWSIILSQSVAVHAWTVYRMVAGIFFAWFSGIYLRIRREEKIS